MESQTCVRPDGSGRDGKDHSQKCPPPNTHKEQSARERIPMELVAAGRAADLFKKNQKTVKI